MTCLSLRPLPPRTQMAPAAAIKVVYVQPGYSRYAEPGTVHRCQNGPMAEVLRRRQQRFHFFLAENDRELFLAARQGNPLDLNLSGQGMTVEEAEPADGLNIARRLYVLLIEQVQLPRADLFRPQLVGRLVEVFGEIGDRA